MCEATIWKSQKSGSSSITKKKNILFSGTVKENLRWGNKNASDEELKEACRLACADEFISQFPGRL